MNKEELALKEEIRELKIRIRQLNTEIAKARAEKMRRRDNKRGCTNYCEKGKPCPIEQKCPYRELDHIKPRPNTSLRTGYEIWADELEDRFNFASIFPHL